MLTYFLLGLTRSSYLIYERFLRESHEVKRLAQHLFARIYTYPFFSRIFDLWKCELAFVPGISSQGFVSRPWNTNAWLANKMFKSDEEDMREPNTLVKARCEGLGDGKRERFTNFIPDIGAIF